MVGTPAYAVAFRDQRRLLEIPELGTDSITASDIAHHVQPHLRHYKGWEVELGPFRAGGLIIFKDKHVGPISFTVKRVG